MPSPLQLYTVGASIIAGALGRTPGYPDQAGIISAFFTPHGIADAFAVNYPDPTLITDTDASTSLDISPGTWELLDVKNANDDCIAVAAKNSFAVGGGLLCDTGNGLQPEFFGALIHPSTNFVQPGTTTVTSNGTDVAVTYNNGDFVQHQRINAEGVPYEQNRIDAPWSVHSSVMPCPESNSVNVGYMNDATGNPGIFSVTPIVPTASYNEFNLGTDPRYTEVASASVTTLSGTDGKEHRYTALVRDDAQSQWMVHQFPLECEQLPEEIPQEVFASHGKPSSSDDKGNVDTNSNLVVTNTYNEVSKTATIEMTRVNNPGTTVWRNVHETSAEQSVPAKSGGCFGDGDTFCTTVTEGQFRGVGAITVPANNADPIPAGCQVIQQGAPEQSSGTVTIADSSEVDVTPTEHPQLSDIQVSVTHGTVTTNDYCDKTAAPTQEPSVAATAEESIPATDQLSNAATSAASTVLATTAAPTTGPATTSPATTAAPTLPASGIPTAQETKQKTNQETPQPTEDDGLSTGAKVGIGIAIGVGLLGAGFFVGKRSSANKTPTAIGLNAAGDALLENEPQEDQQEQDHEEDAQVLGNT